MSGPDGSLASRLLRDGPYQLEVDRFEVRRRMADALGGAEPWPGLVDAVVSMVREAAAYGRGPR